jgi:hypothetical protein
MAPSVLIAQRSSDTAARAARTTADTAIILASATGSTSIRLVLHHSAGVHLSSLPLERRGDTVSIATPATLIFDRTPLDLELSAVTGDLRVQTTHVPYDCIAEGPFLKFDRAQSAAPLRFHPDPRTRVSCMKRGR